MSNTKVTQHVIANNAITADQIASSAVTDAKLHSTLDLSGKTLTLPATSIPSASTATTQAASDNSTKIATTAYVTTAVANLVDSSPSSLDTLNELAAALNDDASFSTTVTNSIATKLPLAGGTMTGAIAMGTSKITGLGDPTASQDAGTKTYIDTADALKLNLTGGTLTGDLILNTTTALKIPAGTTGQRPSAATGQIRWNTTDGALEVYNGSAWTAVGTGSSNKILDTFTGDGSTTDFTLSVTPANEDALMVFIDGVYQEKGDYVLTNAVLALDTAPASGEKIACHITTASVHDGTSALNQQFTATSGQTAFTLSQDPKSENNTQVYINGVYQQKTDYTVSGTTLTFDTGLTVGDVVEVNMFTVATLGNTDTVSEGSSNLYHTTARARSAISVSGNALSYNSSTGVITSAYEESPTFTGTVTSAGLAVDTTTLVVDATNDRVGIGTASPQAGLDITSSSKGTWSSGNTYHIPSGNAYIKVQGTAAQDNWIGITGGYDQSSGSANLLLQANLRLVNEQAGNYISSEAQSSTAADITFGKMIGGSTTSGNSTKSEFMRIDSSGNVGIGTDSPLTNLHIGSGTAGENLGLKINRGATTNFLVACDGTKQAYIGVDNSNAYIKLGSLSNHPVQISQNNDNAIYIDTSKNVGIGVIPAHKLDVLSTDNKGFLLDRNTGNEPANLNEFSNYYSLSIKNRASGSYLNFGGNANFTSLQGTDGASSATAKNIVLNPYGGNVGIGTISPSRQLTLYTTSNSSYNSSSMETSNLDLYMRNADTTVNNHAGIQFAVGNNSDAAIACVRTSDANAALTFGTRGTGSGNIIERMRIKSDGQITTQGDILPGADVIMANGRGISFAATSNTSATGASMSNELFDDYEEGTWTPVLTTTGGSAATHTQQTGQYTKIGNMVHVHGTIRASSGANAGGSTIISGLPFTSLSTGGTRNVGSMGAMNGAGTDAQDLRLVCDPNSTFIYVIRQTGQNYSHGANMNSAVDIYGFSIVYSAA